MKRRNPLMWGGIVFLALLIALALFGPTFRYNYLDPVALPNLGASGKFWMGTDDIGRDVFSRIAYGARISLLIGLTVQAISLTLGIVVAVIGTYAKSWIASPLLRLTDAMFAFPDILLAILLIGIIESAQFPANSPMARFISTGVLPVIAALAVSSWPSIARLVKTQLATLKDREFVVASKASGASTFYLVTRHILPQLWGILMAVTMIELAGTILAESTLSFLGIGIQAPIPSWGSMIDNSRQYINSHPITLVWPCLMLSLTIFALNFVGDGVRTLIDPRSK